MSIDRIRMGTVEESFNAKAVIIRDCITYEAEFNGICIPGIEDGEKVPSIQDSLGIQGSPWNTWRN